MAGRIPTPEVLLALRGVPLARVGVPPRDVSLSPVDGAMLAWLALTGPVPRERLAALLWPDSPADAARNALRQRLFRLRRQVGADLVAAGAHCALAAQVRHDLDEDDAPLLASIALVEHPGLEGWLTAERERRRAMAQRRLREQLDAAEAAGDLASAMAGALRLREADPLSEDAHRRVIRLHYLLGDRSAALVAFDQCERTLKDEVGTTPSEATRALLRTIEQEAAAAAPAAGAPVARGALPAALRRPPRLVGREAELDALRRAWAAATPALLVGDAGMGKSRLLDGLAASLDAGVTTVVAASARAGDPLVPFATLGRLLKAVLAVAGGGLPGLDALTRRHLARVLPALAPEGAGPAAGATSADVAEAVARLLAACEAAADGVLLDDLHFADQASLELLQTLLSDRDGGDGGAPPAWRWVLASRPAAPGSACDTLLAAVALARPVVQVTLAPLAPTAVAELLTSLLDALGLSAERVAALAPALHQRGGGNPLYMLETLKSAWSEGGDAFAAPANLPAPASVGQLIGQQLQRLPEGALALARMAAVAGEDFSPELAEAVSGRDLLALADDWQQLEQRHVIRGTEFTHDLVRDAVLQNLPAVLAARLHARVAQALQGDAAAEPARVAAHWERAGQPVRAIAPLRAAAARAHAALREDERIACLMRAAGHAETAGLPDDAFDCLHDAVEGHMNTIRQAGGFPLLDRLDRLAADPRRRAQAAGARAWYHGMLGDWDEAATTGRAALEAALAIGDESLAAMARQRLGTALSMRGRFDEALPHLDAASPWIERHGQPDEVAECLGNQAAVLDNLGRVEDAWPLHQRVLANTQAHGDHAHGVTALANIAVNRLNAGDVEAAARHLGQAQALVQRYGLQGSSAGFVAALHTTCHRARGGLAAALACAERARAIIAARNPAMLPMVALHEVPLWLDLAQHARARQVLDEMGQVPLAPRVQARRLLLQSRLGLALGQDGRPALDEALQCAPRTGWPEVLHAVRIERATLEPDPHAALRDLDAVAAEAQALGQRGTVLAARLRAAVVAARDATALKAAERAAAVASAGPVDTLAVLLTPAERWWAPAQAWWAAGRHDEARRLLGEAQRWLDNCEQDLPAVWRDGWRHRNPVHRALAALWARADLGGVTG